MLRCIEGQKTRAKGQKASSELQKRAADPTRRFLILYHPGETNHCPGCGGTQWLVGRLSAECGFCGTALALVDTGMTGVGLLHRPRLAEAA